MNPTHSFVCRSADRPEALDCVVTLCCDDAGWPSLRTLWYAYLETRDGREVASQDRSKYYGKVHCQVFTEDDIYDAGEATMYQLAPNMSNIVIGFYPVGALGAPGAPGPGATDAPMMGPSGPASGAATSPIPIRHQISVPTITRLATCTCPGARCVAHPPFDWVAAAPPAKEFNPSSEPWLTHPVSPATAAGFR